MAELLAQLLRVALPVVRHLALPRQLVAVVPGRALVRVVEVRAVPRVVTDVRAPRALAARTVLDREVAPAAVLPPALRRRARDVQAVPAGPEGRALVCEGGHERKQPSKHREG